MKLEKLVRGYNAVCKFVGFIVVLYFVTKKCSEIGSVLGYKFAARFLDCKDDEDDSEDDSDEIKEEYDQEEPKKDDNKEGEDLIIPAFISSIKDDPEYKAISE